MPKEEKIDESTEIISIKIQNIQQTGLEEVRL